MKFFYKTGGKTLAFILCILCAAITLAACAGACMMLSEDYYTRSERAIYDDAIRGNLITDGDRVIREAAASGFCPVQAKITSSAVTACGISSLAMREAAVT